MVRPPQSLYTIPPLQSGYKEEKGFHVKTSSLVLYLITIVLLVLPGVSAGKSLIPDVHRIDILNLFISETSLTCNKNIYTVIEYKNAGTDNELVHLELVNEQLGINEFTPVAMLQPNRLGSITIPIALEQEPEGEVEFEVLAYFNNEIRRYFKSFTFAGCPEAPNPTSMPDATLLAQTSQEAKNQPQGWSTQTWFVTLMVIIIFILVIIYILKLYIERIRGKE